MYSKRKYLQMKKGPNGYLWIFFKAMQLYFRAQVVVHAEYILLMDFILFFFLFYFIFILFYKLYQKSQFIMDNL